MPKRFISTLKSIEKRIKEGYGTGEESNYIPWIKIQDFASVGRSHRISNPFHGRIHHVFSDFEEKMLYLYLWSDEIIDIREQFPLLPLEETLDIADRLGLKHSTDPKSKYPSVMTTDFFLKKKSDFGDVFIARTAKFTSALKVQRTLEKLQIEKVYWQQRNIDWKIVTEKNLSVNLFRNVKWVFANYTVQSLKPLNPEEICNIAFRLEILLTEHNYFLYPAAKECDRHFGLVVGTTVNIVRHLISRKIWTPDLRNRNFKNNRVIISPTEMRAIQPVDAF